jgi:hypothetical protein
MSWCGCRRAARSWTAPGAVASDVLAGGQSAVATGYSKALGEGIAIAPDLSSAGAAVVQSLHAGAPGDLVAVGGDDDVGGFDGRVACVMGPHDAQDGYAGGDGEDFGLVRPGRAGGDALGHLGEVLADGVMCAMTPRMSPSS